MSSKIRLTQLASRLADAPLGPLRALRIWRTMGLPMAADVGHGGPRQASCKSDALLWKPT